MKLSEHLGIETSIIGGPMYPCSNPELVAAVSQAGGIGIVQPVTLTYVNGYDFREGLHYIKSLTSKPIGFNALIEQSSKVYEKKMMQWIDIALQEGIRFFITSLGNPAWVVKKVHAQGGLVYHDATEPKWAKIAQKVGVDGLIAVNNEAGGHAGIYNKKELFELLEPFGLPLVCAGGIGDKRAFNEAVALGYSGVQMGTRFIASKECDVPLAYKQAIISAKKEDIVLTQNLTGINVSIIQSQSLNKHDIKPNIFLHWALHNSFLKKITRLFMVVKSLRYLKKTLHSERKDRIWQAGKSVDSIDEIKTVQSIFEDFS